MQNRTRPGGSEIQSEPYSEDCSPSNAYGREVYKHGESYIFRCKVYYLYLQFWVLHFIYEIGSHLKAFYFCLQPRDVSRLGMQSCQNTHEIPPSLHRSAWDVPRVPTTADVLCTWCSLGAIRTWCRLYYTEHSRLHNFRGRSSGVASPTEVTRTLYSGNRRNPQAQQPQRVVVPRS